MASEEWTGRWWLPGRETMGAEGELLVTKDEFVLQLAGSLIPPPTQVPPDGGISSFFRDVQEPIVLGVSRTGEKFTLLDCEGAAPDTLFPVSKTAWRPTAALVGAHLEDLGELTFTGVGAEFDYLLDWASARLAQELTVDGQPARPTRIAVELQPEVVGSASLGDATVKLIVDRDWTTGRRRAEVELRPRFQVELSAAIGWKEAMRRWVGPLRDLVSFATLRGARIEDIRLRPHGAQERGWLRLLLRLTDLRRAPRSDRPLNPHDMLFTARQLPGGFQAALCRWFALCEAYSSVVTLMLGVDYAPFFYDDQRFLAFAQAAEIYHRVKVDGGTRLPPQEHRRRVDAVLAAVPDKDLAAWARPILAEANWLRLAERLQDLVAGLNDLGQQISGGDSDRFVRRVVDTRNYLTHRDRKTQNVLEGEERYWHGQALAWLLRAYLLQVLGFEADEVARIVRENIRFQFFAERIH